ncbi:MAG: hypothetical protein COU82_01910 [Candidatus Portnoybacteria bacterium CG10_big_fil_rev_8_21_14_0_10_38_18]|uniref:Uncharacterized protein n=1 Tax=Candidatus Portnoybacteria bacterium CG10_big_fil_rev_8_21_14_0_10_38_18 TaxID=1974813 RepID=A0A2M8KBZ5_9BACT|nr:MAG: hypothetical protein COU82_01910 [Candidatus Portnoybacteria bacterium CG10_big_fil_rev_8_21_14_0_10_38_18]
MKNKTELSKTDKTFLLKMIMVADLKTSAYKFLSKNQATLTGLETDPNGDLPDNYLNELKDKEGKIKEVDREILGKILKIIRTEPLSSRLESPLSKIFYLVGFFEELQPDTIEFNKFAAEAPDRAIEFLVKIEWDFDSRISSLIAEISQDAGKLDFDINQANDDQKKILNTFRNRTSTMIKVLNNYTSREGFTKKIEGVTTQFFSIFPPLSDRLKDGLGNLEIPLLNLALSLTTEEFWGKLMEINSFNDFNNLTRVIDSLDTQKTHDSAVSKPLFNKLNSFLDSNFDDVIKLIENKNLLTANTSDELQGTIANFFTLQSDINRRDKIFELFKANEVIFTNYLIIMDDLLNKSDYQKLEILINNQRSSQILSSQRAQKLKDFIITVADLNNEQFLNFFKSLWTQENIRRFNLLETNFLNSLIDKLNQVNPDFKQNYIGILINVDLKETISNMGATMAYINGIDLLKQNLDKNLRAKLTRFQTALKGGGNNARKAKSRSSK